MNYLGVEETTKWAMRCNKDLKIYYEHHQSNSELPSDCLNPKITIEILKFIFDNPLAGLINHSDFKEFLTSFEETLDFTFTCCDEQISALILIQIVPNLLRLYDDRRRNLLVEKLWRRTEGFFKFKYSDCREKSVGIGFLILCNVMEYYATSKLIEQNSLTQIYNQNYFWYIIQLGLTHENSLYRKRVLYILRQIITNFESNSSINLNDVVFTWDKSKNILWNNFLLILETLEEKQIHVIKPMLMRFQELVKLSRNNSKSMHISWIITIYHRMFIHETKFVKKWAVLNFLQITFSREELTDPKINEFIFLPLLNTLNDGSLFAKSQQESHSSLPAVANALTEFLIRCSHGLHGSDYIETFFCSLLRNILCLKWASTPLLYLSYALAKLPPSPVWNLNAVLDLRQLSLEPLRTQEKFLRVAIHCYLLEAFLKLVKLEELTFAELSFVLVPFVRDSALRRDAQLWEMSVQWLKKVTGKNLMQTEDAVLFCKTMIKKLTDFSDISKNDLFVNEAVPDRFARVLLLLLDAELLKVFDPKCSVVSIFHPLTNLLMTMNSRAYLPNLVIDRCLQFIVLFLEGIQFSRKIAEEDLVKKLVRKWIFPCVSSIVDFVSKQISSGIVKMEDVDRLELYLRLFTIVSRTYPHDETINDHLIKVAKNSFEDFVQSTNIKENQAELQKYTAVKTLAWIAKTLTEKANCKNVCCQSRDVILNFVRLLIERKTLSEPLKKCDLINKNEDGDKVLLNHWGRVVSDYISCVWTCALFYVNQCQNEINSIFLTESALLSLEIGTDVIPAVCPCLKLLLPEVLKRDKNLFKKVLRCVWNSSFERRKTEAFWNAINSFFDMSYQPSLMNSFAVELLQHYATEAYLLADTCPTVFCSLVFHCCSIWRKSKNIQLVQHHTQLVANALTFGPVHRKDQKVGFEAAGYICSLGSECAANGVTESDHLDDSNVRASAVSLVLTMNDTSFIHELVRLLISEDKRVTSERTRYYANSFIHLKKNRIWQSLLVLEPMCSEDVVTDLLNCVYEELMKEGSQLSIRLMQEWLAVRILIRFPNLQCQLWERVKIAGDVRVGSVGSFLSIICHTAKLIHEKEFVLSAINCTFPWCMAQNFNTRVTAQVVLNQLWNVCERYKLNEVLDKYIPIKSCLDFTCQNGNASRYTQKLMEDFYFSVFDCVKHFTLQTIFNEIPRLTHIQECISPDRFLELIDSDKEHIAINNNNDLLSGFEATLSKDTDDEFMENETEILSGNVQKKITPWRQLLGDEGILLETDEESKRSDLIVVASLIDRVPNLGGLCRSCEIFGANEYVLNSIKCIDDKQFQNLSVSAEKWLTISEVKPFQLREYLLAMKNKGYTLIGAEQTADSTKLHEYKFPQKSLLLLGNEKEGIPVSLIQLLDVCIEIPQQGVVRSLNVHVSGAVIIWEYARQHIVQNTN